VIRRIAQWAVNCVDFRDPDSIMTPFEFDYNPWDGWQVDGDLATDAGLSLGPENLQTLGTPPNGVQPMTDPTQRGVGWGMEFPELLITETLAFHDRRVKDTDKDNGKGKKVNDSSAMPPNEDLDLDQFRVPQGSLFVELYCPRARTWTAAGESVSQKP